jgi:hypothetical protein
MPTLFSTSSFVFFRPTNFVIFCVEIKLYTYVSSVINEHIPEASTSRASAPSAPAGPTRYIQSKTYLVLYYSPFKVKVANGNEKIYIWLQYVPTIHSLGLNLLVSRRSRSSYNSNSVTVTGYTSIVAHCPSVRLSVRRLSSVTFTTRML